MNVYHIKSGSENFDRDLIQFMGGDKPVWQHPAIISLLYDLHGVAEKTNDEVLVRTDSNPEMLALFLQSLLRHYRLDLIISLDSEEKRFFVNRWGLVKFDYNSCKTEDLIKNAHNSVALRNPESRKSFFERIFRNIGGLSFLRETPQHEDICLVEFNEKREKWRLVLGSPSKNGFGPFRRRMLHLPSSSLASALEIAVGICDIEPKFTFEGFNIAKNFRCKYEKTSDELIALSRLAFFQ